MEIEICFADKGDECVALTVKKCLNCNFFKTKQQVNNDRADAKGIPTGNQYVRMCQEAMKNDRKHL